MRGGHGPFVRLSEGRVLVKPEVDAPAASLVEALKDAGDESTAA